jgi:hypothetical protein
VILSGRRDFARRAVRQPRVRPVVVAVDVGPDLFAGLVEGLELFARLLALRHGARRRYRNGAAGDAEEDRAAVRALVERATGDFRAHGAAWSCRA